LDDSYLIAASLYIHLNPVRANLADDPQRYRWSSCRLYCDPKAKKSFVDPHFVLGLFPQDPKGKYRQLLEQARIRGKNKFILTGCPTHPACFPSSTGLLI